MNAINITLNAKSIYIHIAYRFIYAMKDSFAAALDNFIALACSEKCFALKSKLSFSRASETKASFLKRTVYFVWLSFTIFLQFYDSAFKNFLPFSMKKKRQFDVLVNSKI